MDYDKKSLALHKRFHGKMAIVSKVPLANKHDLSTSYTPGVAEPCRQIARDKKLARELTIKGNSVAVITDGTAVLGLGNIGPEAALPVMEGKSILFKKYADIDAYPICIKAKSPKHFIETVIAIAPGFGGINLEDIAAPHCFDIERELKRRLDIPVFHDDQHGTAIVALAALINACKLLGRKLATQKVVIVGAGAAGTAIAELFLKKGIRDIVLCDRHGSLYPGRAGMDRHKRATAKKTNPRHVRGTTADALKGADVMIGVSAPHIITRAMVRAMNKDTAGNGPVIMAMSNPIPEIEPADAFAAGASIVATGRSDHPNQTNNVLAFPGIFRGALDAGTKNITMRMKLAAAEAIAALVKKPRRDKIIPSPFDKGVMEAVAEAVRKCA